MIDHLGTHDLERRAERKQRLVKILVLGIAMGVGSAILLLWAGFLLWCAAKFALWLFSYM
ncbi:hypothetical protein GCM10011390_10980 [Aureimonas endophytica]|uniref:Uncharacterized protein n=1 Tax=Aureimonas endophytica TaxID=2027858 RepID=A0A916ZF45_9HYPH|nr:hypothetical protein [Aureimonas endophytica]GGD94067.1 hypothetical protein GCM10011390_10980 [Aureimonas endophytica]